MNDGTTTSSPPGPTPSARSPQLERRRVAADRDPEARPAVDGELALEAADLEAADLGSEHAAHRLRSAHFPNQYEQ